MGIVRFSSSTKRHAVDDNSSNSGGGLGTVACDSTSTTEHIENKRLDDGRKKNEMSID